MTLARLFVQRIVLGILAAWGVLSVVFALFTLTNDWVLATEVGMQRWGGADDETIEAVTNEYLAERGLDQPFWQLYLDWMTSMFVLDWGQSFEHGEPVRSLIVERIGRTALYVVPALALAVVAGILVGVFAALKPDSRLANSSVQTSYLLFALPNFWIGGILVGFVTADVIGYSTILFEHVLPIALTASTLLGAYVSYTRAHSLEYMSSDVVSLVKAKGARSSRVMSHVIRNAAIPLVSMVFTEALALLVLAIFIIETLFDIDGFGLLLFESVQTRDLPVLMGGVLCLIVVGVIGNTLQDLAYSQLDPRVDTGTR